MSNHPPPFSEDALAQASREEIMSALFENMVIQQTNMAMMMLGKVAHPETGQFFHDLEAAKMFIDQLEMIAAKTKGNLTREEDGLLKQGLTALRMAFVDALDHGGVGSQPHGVDAGLTANEDLVGALPQPVPEAGKVAAPPVPPPAPAAAAAPTASPTEESRKKFSKKY